MASQTFINKLLHNCDSKQSTDDIKYYIYVRSLWREEKIEFLLSCSSSSKNYNGILYKAQLMEAANELDKNYDVFYEECKAALTANISFPGFQYNIHSGVDPTFTLIKRDQFEVQYLEIKLSEVDTNQFKMLDTAIEMLAEKQQQIEEMEHTNTNSNKSFELHSEFINEGKSMERKLLKKFILLLNSKKENIEELQEKVRRLECGKNIDTEDDDDYMCETQAMTLPTSFGGDCPKTT